MKKVRVVARALAIESQELKIEKMAFDTLFFVYIVCRFDSIFRSDGSVHFESKAIGIYYTGRFFLEKKAHFVVDFRDVKKRIRQIERRAKTEIKKETERKIFTDIIPSSGRLLIMRK